MKTTHIGSLPHLDFIDACNLISSLTYFTLPELVVKESNLMMNKGIKAMVENNFLNLIPELNISVEELKIKKLVIHVVGPITLFTYSKNPQVQIDRLDDYFKLLFELDIFLSQIFSDIDVYICLDEPGLNYFEFSIEADSIIYQKALKNFKSKIGIHCCDDFLAIKTYADNLDFISFPFHQENIEGLQDLSRNFSDLEFFCGIYDHDNGPRYNKEQLEIINQLIPNIVWTPDCGLGLKSIEEATKIISYLRNLV